MKKTKLVKILIISHSASLNGAEKALIELVSLFSEKGVICSVVLPKNGPLKNDLISMGIKCYVVPFGWWVKRKFDSPKEEVAQNKKNLQAITKIKKLIESINSDIVITNTIVIPWGALAAFAIKKPHIWMIHELGNKDHGFKFELPYKKILGIINILSNLIIVNSEAVKNHIAKVINIRKILRNYYAIKIKKNELVIKKSYFKDRNSFKIVLVGRIVKSKGQKDAVLAVKELIKKNLNVKLLLIGKSKKKNFQYIEEIHNIIKKDKLSKKIKIYGYKKNPFPFVKEADIVLMCSKNEAFGRVTLEAMLLGKPVIGTNTGGTKELIKNGYNGFLYPFGDYKKLAKIIEFLYFNREKLIKFGKKSLYFANKIVNHKNNFDKVCENIFKIKNQ